jgi:hypothetical protein
MDAWTTSNREFTFWIAKYLRHTNFAVAELQMPFQNNATFGRNRITAQLMRSGDLLNGCYIYASIDPIAYDGTPGSYDISLTPPAAAWYVNSLGHAMIRDVKLIIGNTEFDTHTGEFLELSDQLMAPPEKLLGEMDGHYNTVQQLIFAAQNQQHLYTPMRFWFNRFHEQALPMVSLYWHEVDLYLSTRSIDDLTVVSGGAVGHVTVPQDPAEMHMLCNYVYLDRPERAAFANGKHEYVFRQTQFLGEEAHPATSASQNHNIRFNNPVTEIIFVCQQDAHVAAKDYFEYGGIPEGAPDVHAADPIRSAQILLNNQERTIMHPARYYRLVQPWQCHSRVPNGFIYCYSFAKDPENLLETGSVNMSRMDSAVLRVLYKTGAQAWPGQFRCYATSIQITKVNAGMMGVKFGG